MFKFLKRKKPSQSKAHAELPDEPEFEGRKIAEIKLKGRQKLFGKYSLQDIRHVIETNTEYPDWSTAPFFPLTFLHIYKDREGRHYVHFGSQIHTQYIAEMFNQNGKLSFYLGTAKEPHYFSDVYGSRFLSEHLRGKGLGRKTFEKFLENQRQRFGLDLIHPDKRIIKLDTHKRSTLRMFLRAGGKITASTKRLMEMKKISPATEERMLAYLEKNKKEAISFLVEVIFDLRE